MSFNPTNSVSLIASPGTQNGRYVSGVIDNTPYEIILDQVTGEIQVINSNTGAVLSSFAAGRSEGATKNLASQAVFVPAATIGTSIPSLKMIVQPKVQFNSLVTANVLGLLAPGMALDFSLRANTNLSSTDALVTDEVIIPYGSGLLVQSAGMNLASSFICNFGKITNMLAASVAKQFKVCYRTYDIATATYDGAWDSSFILKHTGHTANLTAEASSVA